MRFFEEAIQCKMPKHPVSGALQGLLFGAIFLTQYDISTKNDGAEKSTFIASSYLLCLSLGTLIGSIGYCLHTENRAEEHPEPNLNHL